MFPESDPSPYLIVETHESVRHYYSWSRTLAAPPVLATDLAVSPSWCSFHSVPSDLTGEWEYIEQRDSEPLDFCAETIPNVSLQPNVKSEAPRYKCEPDGAFSL
jgi:hypothetical protein